MKSPFLFLFATLSLSSFAQVQNEHPCFEFDQKMNLASQQVKEFDREIRKLEGKLNNIETRLSERTQVLNSLLSQRERLNDTSRTLGGEQSVLRQEIQRKQMDATNLRNSINQKESQRQYHVAQASATSDLNIKREHLRASKLLEREIGVLQPQLTSIDQSITASNQRIHRIDLQIQQLPSQLAEINRQIDQEQRDPAVIRLQQDRTQALNELSNAQSNSDALNIKLTRASSHVNMCYGYLELSVKYPTALKIAKRLNKVGCNRYVSDDQGSELANQAQDDVVSTVCR
jgi:chromosome segregation ATPase